MEKPPFCLKHGYNHADNMESDYVGFFFIRQGAEASFLLMEAQSHPHYASEASQTHKNFFAL